MVMNSDIIMMIFQNTKVYGLATTYDLETSKCFLAIILLTTKPT